MLRPVRGLPHAKRNQRAKSARSDAEQRGAHAKISKQRVRRLGRRRSFLPPRRKRSRRKPPSESKRLHPSQTRRPHGASEREHGWSNVIIHKCRVYKIRADIKPSFETKLEAKLARRERNAQKKKKKKEKKMCCLRRSSRGTQILTRRSQSALGFGYCRMGG